MDNFFTFNALNFFSLVLLILIYTHAEFYFKQKQEILWKKVLRFAIITQALDIACWYIELFTGNTAIVFSYILNILLFTASMALTISAALFFHHLLKGYDKKFYQYKKVFYSLIGIQFLLLCLNTIFHYFFYVDSSNIYHRNFHYFIVILFILYPLLRILVEMIIHFMKTAGESFRRNKTVFSLIIINVAMITFLVFIQGRFELPVTTVFPALSLSLVLLDIILISKTISIDYLTNIENKFGVEIYFSQLPKMMKQYVVAIFLDLDDFKQINDTFGHKEGDNILKQFAQILSSETKNKDLAARFGGDEFLVVLLVDKLEEVNHFIRAIQFRVDEKNKHNLAIKMGFSYGLSSIRPNMPINKDILIAEADKQMYENKSQNKKAQ